MKIIAIEEHFVTPMYREKVGTGTDYRRYFLTALGEQLGHDIRAQLIDLGEERLRQMDAYGVDVEVLSFGAPGPQGFEKDIAVPMARDANDQLRQAIDRHPDRFAGFAALPTADVDEACRELERCVKGLGFKGAMIHGHQRGEFLDAKKYWPIFAAAEQLDVPIYLHPTVPHPDVARAYFGDYEELEGAPWGFGIDTSCHFLRLVFSGLFDTHPKLKIILGHLGEGLPFAMHRMNDRSLVGAKRRGLKKTPLQYIKDNLLVTTSGNWYEPAFVCTLLALGADNILWAVDWPYESNSEAMAFFAKLSLNDGDKEKIAHLNAERVLRM
jgi:predicted TIM-barrel fold metal-dependent hydrolase